MSRDTVLAGDHRIRARRFVIATGSSPAIPPIPGLDSVPYFTNETIFENRHKLDHLIVVGGGPIGLELAQAHSCALAAASRCWKFMKALSKDDPEASAVVLKQLKAEGLELREGAMVERVSGGLRLIDINISDGGTQSDGAGHASAHRDGTHAQRRQSQPRSGGHQSTTSGASR